MPAHITAAGRAILYGIDGIGRLKLTIVAPLCFNERLAAT